MAITGTRREWHGKYQAREKQITFILPYIGKCMCSPVVYAQQLDGWGMLEQLPNQVHRI